MLFDVCRQKYALIKSVSKYTNNMILLHLIVTLVVTERPLAHAVCDTAVFPFLRLLNYEAGRNINIFVLEY